MLQGVWNITTLGRPSQQQMVPKVWMMSMNTLLRITKRILAHDRWR